MTRTQTIQHKSVEAIPETIEEGTLYVCREYSTAVHKCCCGCGHEVVTPLGPTDWKIKTQHGCVSVYPSIGNWSFACKSHYWIRDSRIFWAEQLSESQISSGRMKDRIAKQEQYRHASGLAGSLKSFLSWLSRFILKR